MAVIGFIGLGNMGFPMACRLKEAGHEVAVHDWEIPAGGNAPLWMNNKLAWADRL